MPQRWALGTRTAGFATWMTLLGTAWPMVAGEAVVSAHAADRPCSPAGKLGATCASSELGPGSRGGLATSVPARVPAPAPNATGSVLRSVLPAVSGIGRAVAIDTASGHLYYSTYLSTSPYIYAVDFAGVEITRLLTLDCVGGPLAWDESTGTLWAMNYTFPGFGLYELDPMTGNTIYSCDIRAANPSHPAVRGIRPIGYNPDGLDYDPVRDTFWASSEYEPPNWVVEIDKSCIIRSAFQPAIRGNEGSSGVAVDRDGLWLAYPSGQAMVQVDTSGTPSGVEFLLGGPPEDLEHDPVTFAPLCAVWANEIAGSRMTAYEVPCQRCGNGTVDRDEQCDDSNQDPTDLCATDCTFTRCGDGVVQTPNGERTGGPLGDGVEACDDGLATARCNANCTLTRCGDGVIQTPNGAGRGGPADDGNEACDDGLATARCNGNCTLTRCGDGTVQSPNGDGTGGTTGRGDEECDDGNDLPRDGCYRCVLESCLVGAIEPIQELLAVKSTDQRSVVMSWRPDLSADGYNVWHVALKTRIPSARQGGTGLSPTGCGPTPVATCRHLDAVPPLPAGPLLYYQVRGACGSTEAAE